MKGRIQATVSSAAGGGALTGWGGQAATCTDRHPPLPAMGRTRAEPGLDTRVRAAVPFGRGPSADRHHPHARTYSLGGLRADGKAGAQQAPQCRRELQLGCAPSVKAGPEQDGKVAHLRGGPDDHSGPRWGQMP